MHQLLQTLSSVAFFISYYYYDIYFASLVLSTLSACQLLLGFISPNQSTSFENMSLGMLTVFGLSTWYFHNPLYIQWKVTILHALIALFIFAYITTQKQSLFAGVLKSQNIQIPQSVGLKADNLLATFMFSVSLINYYIFTFCSEYTWVLFKTCLIFVNLTFLFLLAMYLGQYIKTDQLPTSQ